MAKKEAESTSKFSTKAEELAQQQREISVAAFFEKNRHLLGFDSPVKALATAVKEMVDNSLDACEEMHILPEVIVLIKEAGEGRYVVSVEDNGPGIVKEQIPRVFAKLLYGSKFYRFKQSLTADEQILIKRNNKVELTPIGAFVDSILKKTNEEITDISHLDIFVPAFNTESKKYSMQKVSHIIRHKRENEILKIKTQYNKEIKVTGCHSLFTFNHQTAKVESVEARTLKIGDYVIVPKKLPEIDSIEEINILGYINYEDIKNNWAYVYDIRSLVKKLKSESETVWIKKDKVRKHYRLKHKDLVIDVIAESMDQYTKKGFLPLPIVYQLGLIKEVSTAHIVTYRHGKKYRVPVTIPLDKAFIRFLGIYIAEGHPDVRQIGLTFGKHEQGLIDEVINFAQVFGLGCAIEPREKSIRVKFFNNLFVKLVKNICGKGAFNKKVPEFLFRVSRDLRKHFIDAYCQGDGHKVKGRNCLMFGTKSKELAFSLQYLLLMNGVTSTYSASFDKGLGKKETMTHKVAVYGSGLNESYIYQRAPVRQTKRLIEYNDGKVIGALVHELKMGDLGFVQITGIEAIHEGYEYVYDISVPGCENFVGGIGGMSCHNSRGQQGIGVSASVLYGQLTTGKPARITSRISTKKPTHYYELHIDITKNEPEIVVDKEIEWMKDHGTKVEIEMEGKYQKGRLSVDEYLKQTAISNPHVNLTYINPSKEKFEFKRVTNKLPKEPKEIKPHPYGIELGVLIRMMKNTESRNVRSFLSNEFSRVSSTVADEILQKAGVNQEIKPQEIAHQDADKIFKAIQQVKIMSPPTDCLSPIGEELLIKGLKKEVNAEFYTAISRSPAVYRGVPFQVEVAIAYGGQAFAQDELVRIVRFANKVPLIYQQSACAITKSVLNTDWKNYGLQQSKGALPSGPAMIVVHIASVWVPFTSESKEAIAHYPDIIKEIKLALQECGRKLNAYIRKNVRAKEAKERISLFEKYIPEVADALSELSGKKKDVIAADLQKILKKGLPELMAQAEGEHNGNGKEKE